MSIFEIIMLLSFGLSWPISVYKSLKSTSVEGKSLLFIFIIFIGYIAGITHKILFSFDGVIYLYIFNLIMVGIDLIITYIKKQKNKQI